MGTGQLHSRPCRENTWLFAAFDELLGGDFLDLGVDLFLEEGESLLGIELVDKLLDVLAVLGNGAGSLIETLLYLLLVLTLVGSIPAAKNILHLVDHLVLSGLDGLNLVKSAIEEFPFERRKIGFGPLLFEFFGGEFLIVAARKNPAFEESLGHRSREIVEKLFADLVDEENLALFVVGLFEFGGESLTELVDILDTLTGEYLFEEFLVEFGRGDVGAATEGESNVCFELLSCSGIETEHLLNLRGSESFGNIEDHLLVGFLAHNHSGDFGVFDIGEGK